MRFASFVLSCVLLLPHALLANEPVTLLLKWDHEFQFAGYYAAQWQGYYAKQGLDVSLRTRVQPKGELLDVQQEVLSGRAMFGIGDGLSLLQARSQGKPIVVLAALLQESPYGFYSLREKGITTPQHFIGMRVGTSETAYTHALMDSLLRLHGLDHKRVHNAPMSTSLLSLQRDELDILPTYIVSAEWEALKERIDLNVIKPADYGINFYGDVLFTRQQLVEESPELVLAFTETSLQGWKYAMDNSHTVARRISQELPRQVHFDDIEGYNLFSAAQFRRLMHYPFSEPGSMSEHRWYHMEEMLHEVGMLPSRVDLKSFIFNREHWEQQQLTRYSLYVTLCGIFLLLIVLTLLWRHRNLQQQEKTRASASARLQEVLESSPDAMLVVAEDGTIRFANIEAGRLFGYPEETLPGRMIESLVPSRFTQHADHRNSFTRNASKLLLPHDKRGHDNSPVLYALRQDGSEFPTEIRLNTLQGEERLVLASIRDISERLEEERQRRRLERQVLQAQKMEAIGELSGGIAHDFNNLLAAIMGHTELMAMVAKKNNDTRYENYINEVLRASLRGRDLVQQLMAFCRDEIGEPERLRAEATIQESLELLRPTIPSAIEIHCDFAEYDACIEIEPLKLQQLILNLLINARDAIDIRGNITISTRLQQRVQLNCSACKQDVEGDFVVIGICDNGHGISSEQRQRIFDPFYTTKEVGQGSGMGLSVVHGIIHSAHGHIHVASEEHQGSCFELFLPAQPANP